MGAPLLRSPLARDVETERASRVANPFVWGRQLGKGGEVRDETKGGALAPTLEIVMQSIGKYETGGENENKVAPKTH